MAFYNVKLTHESAVQDPEKPGVDLDQVEKDIAGPDGIEAHRDEVEYATEETDAVAESYNIMYEAEYNFNQIMKCIGIHELSEASAGRDLVLEAGNIKGFFDKVREALTTMFKRVTEIVKNVLAKLDFQFKADKKFVTENKLKIVGGAKAGKWEFEGYEYKEELKLTGLVNNDVRTACEKAFAELDKAGAEADANAILAKELDKAGDPKEALAKTIKDYAGVEADNLADMAKKLVEKLRGAEKVKMSAEKNADMGATVCEILGNARETTRIREEYKNIKAAYAHDIKVIDDMEKAIEKGDKFQTLKVRYASGAIQTIKMQKNVMHSVYGVMMKVARAKRAQARAMAHFFLGVYEKNVKVQHNSASLTDGIFGKVSMI